MLVKLFLVIIFISFFFVSFLVTKSSIFALTSKTLFSAGSNIGNSSAPTNYWKPSESILGESIFNPEEVVATSAIVLDRKSEKIIFQKNPNLKLPIASVTKIMTFLVAVENKPLDSLLEVSMRAAQTEPDSMGLTTGERLTLKQLLSGLILVSGNDSGETIAENIFSINNPRNKFIKQMNQRAYDLGMQNTHFINPTGLEEDSNYNVSTTYDLTLLGHRLLSNPAFLEIAPKTLITIDSIFSNAENHKGFELYNSSPLYDYPGYKGGKPGFTPAAGKCLIAAAERDGREFLVVILNSEDRKADAEKLLNWAFNR